MGTEQEDREATGQREAPQTAVGAEQLLKVGATYSRKRLMELFHITDATVYTGVFRPAGGSSIWLFVTEKKDRDRVAYRDYLDGDDLHWDGQTEGRTDSLIVEHRQRGLEILVFYRRRKAELPGYEFKFEGQFEYVSHSGQRPAHFLLRRPGATLAASPRKPNYWAVVANPALFRVQDYVRDLEVGTWTVTRGEVRPGDRLAIWQSSPKFLRAESTLPRIECGDVVYSECHATGYRPNNSAALAWRGVGSVVR